ncbi:reverse transcriptase domain-containing protein [Tanacetum coccineum]
MIGVPRYIAEHRLNVREKCTPVRQKKRSQAPERNKAIQEEVEGLMEAGIMKEVYYHIWLANLVMVKKNDNSWRMWVDFKDLTKACPKDGYPLPEIDWKVESLCGYPFKCNLDAYKGYHQIKMPHGTRNNKGHRRNIQDPKENKHEAKSQEMHLRGGGGHVPGIHDVQRPNGKLASLNRFLAKSAKKSLPFFKTLKKCANKSDFQWTTKAEAAFKQMKKLIAELPTVTAPMGKEKLIVYLAAAREAVSVVLMTEKEAKKIAEIEHRAGGYDIHYMPKVLIKGQILADFIAERPKDDSRAAPMEVEEELQDPHTLFTDGSSCVDGSRAGLILTNPEGTEFTYALRFEFNATNNEVEYEALIAGLRIAEQMGIKNLQTHVDSRLVANQVNGSYIAKEPGMIQYLEKVKTLTSSFKKFSIKQVPRSENKKADALRSCSMQAGPRSVVAKAIRTRYYWPTMHKDARKVIRECQDYQVHRPVPRNPQQKLTPITSPWPFYKWGIDIVGSFPEGPGKVKFLIVAIDYFTKWIEAKPVATITGNQVKKFVWDNIVCRFGLPGEIISYNGKQFRYNPFKDWCEKLNIRQCFASIKYPQTNGLVERANKSLGEGTKARLDKGSNDWMEEISYVLWAHRTMIKSSNGDTRFLLTYEMEAVILAEIGMPTLMTIEIDMVQNDEALKLNMDLLEEKREQEAIREARSNAKMKKYYNSKVRNTNFKPGDLVYRNNDANHAEDGGKLGPKWEGPYEVI